MAIRAIPARLRERKLEREKGSAGAYIAEARKQCRGDSEMQIDEDPEVSMSESGAWVAAWIWVDRESAGFLKGGKQLRSWPAKSPARGLPPPLKAEKS